MAELILLVALAGEIARKFVESSDSPTRGMIASGLTVRRLRKESRYEERIPSKRRSWEAKIYSEVSGDCGGREHGAIGATDGGNSAAGPRWLWAVAARSGVALDDAGDGARSRTVSRTTSSTRRAARRLPVGERSRLLRSGWAEGAHRADSVARERWSRVAAGQLSVISAERAAARWCVVEDDARADHAQLRSRDQDLPQGL